NLLPLKFPLRGGQLVDRRRLVEGLVLRVDERQLHIRGQQAEGRRQVEHAIDVQKVRAITVGGGGIEDDHLVDNSREEYSSESSYDTCLSPASQSQFEPYLALGFC